MKYYGESEYDFTPNLDKSNVLYTQEPLDWSLVKFRTVYAHRVVCRHRSTAAASTTPVWYPLYDAAYAGGSSTVYTTGCYVGMNYVDGYYYLYQTYYEFNTAFLGAGATVLDATLTLFARGGYLPHQNVYGTGIYMNFYPSAAEFLFTRSGGNPINVPADGSGYAARFGPWPAISGGVYPGWDGANSRETASLSVSSINKVGNTNLIAISSEQLNMAYSGAGKYTGYAINSACITLAYLAG